MTTAIAEDPVKAVIRRYVDDFPFFARERVKIQTKKGDLINFTFNEDQEILEAIEADILKRGRLLREVILKARRRGVSTHRIAKNYHRTIFRFNRYAYHVTHDPDSKDFLFGMTKRMHANNPCKPKELYNSKSILEFNTKDRTGMDSAIRVGAAGKDHLGSGQLIHYLHLCCDENTPVLVRHGRQKAIKDIQVGDVLITHNGNEATVSAVTKKHANEMPQGNRAISITPWNGDAIRVSPDHKVFTSAGWVRAEDIEQSLYLAMPVRDITNDIFELEMDTHHRPRSEHAGGSKSAGVGRKGPDKFPLNKETGFFIGYYLAEGCLTNDTPNGYANINFAFGPGEDDYALRAVEAVASWYDPDKLKIVEARNSKTRTVNVRSVVLANMIDTYFGRKDAKHIPDWAFSAGKDFCTGLVAGYLSGDGSKKIQKKQGYISHAVTASSIRESLTYQVRDIVCSLGLGWGRVSQIPGGLRYGRNCKPQWTVFFNGECGAALRRLMGLTSCAKGAKSDRTTKYFYSGQHVWLKIKHIEDATVDNFVDIAVDHEDHSFRTPHFSMSNSELSKWPRHAEAKLLTSLLQCVPRDPDSEVCVESTAVGLGGEFYEWFWSARYYYEVYLHRGKPAFRVTVRTEADRENEYAAIFLPWFTNSEYKMDPEPGFARTTTEHPIYGNEQEMVKLYGINDCHLKWRRVMIANECKGKPEMFRQEYPSNPEEAFLASGRPVFTPINAVLLRKKALEKQQREEGKDPRKFYSCMYGTGQWIAATPERGDTDGLLQVWEEPQAEVQYVVAADVAEGLEKGDWDSVDVVDQLTGKQVAHWHGHTAPDQLAILLYHIGHRYNVACVAPERNNHGLTTVSKLFNDFEYPNLYVEEIEDPPHKPRKRYGWHTTSSSKPLIIDGMAADFRTTPGNINCVETLGEMLSFKHEDDGMMGAESGRFDDRVISLAIANHVRKRLGLPSSAPPPTPVASGSPVSNSPSNSHGMGGYT